MCLHGCALKNKAQRDATIIYYTNYKYNAGVQNSYDTEISIRFYDCGWIHELATYEHSTKSGSRLYS